MRCYLIEGKIFFLDGPLISKTSSAVNKLVITLYTRITGKVTTSLPPHFKPCSTPCPIKRMTPYRYTVYASMHHLVVSIHKKWKGGLNSKVNCQDVEDNDIMLCLTAYHE